MLKTNIEGHRFLCAVFCVLVSNQKISDFNPGLDFDVRSESDSILSMRVSPKISFPLVFPRK